MSEATELYQQWILPNLNILDALHLLNPEHKGLYYILTCPACQKKSAYYYQGQSHIVCNRKNKCGHSESIWDYVKSSHAIQSNREVLETLAKMANIALPALNNFSEEEFTRKKARIDTLETIQCYFVEQLFSDHPHAVEALGYLHKRGYSDEEIRHMGLGCYLDSSAHKKTFKQFLASLDINAEDLNGLDIFQKAYGTTHRITLPYRSASGIIQSFIFRTVDPSVDPKYLVMKGANKDVVFNFYANQKEEELVIVEGHMDALIAAAKGIKGVVATGGASLTKNQLQHLQSQPSIKRLVLMYDNDKAGLDATDRTIDKLKDSSLQIFVAGAMDHHIHDRQHHKDAIKDPDELIQAKGVEAFTACRDTAQHWSRWKIYHIIAQFDRNSEKEWEIGLECAVEFLVTLEDALNYKKVEDIILHQFQLDPEDIQQRIEAAQVRYHKENAKQFYLSLSRDITHKVMQGDAEALSDYITQSIEKLPSKTRRSLPDPYLMDTALDELAHEGEGLKTGFKELDEFLVVPPSSLGVVAAKSRHGKTTFLLNLMLNQLALYPDKKFVFFTYEEPRRRLTLKLLNILANKLINPTRWMQNQQELLAYIKQGRTDIPEIEQAKKQLSELFASGRLWLVDTHYHAGDLVDVIQTMANNESIGAVYVDYIQKIPIASSQHQNRYLDLKQISEYLLNISIRASLPIIVGCQLNRETGEGAAMLSLDQVRESSDISQDANWVIGLWNNAAEQEEMDPEVMLDIKLLKNRDGQSGKILSLSFDRPVLRLGSPASSNVKYSVL